MVKGKFKLSIIGLALVVLTACGDSEAEEQERQQQIEQEANKQAVEMLEQYKEEADEKRVSPYTISEMEENFGSVYNELRGMIGGFNQDLMGLREDEVTVYDINKKISDYRIILESYDDVDTLKIPDDYYSFYNRFGEISAEYVNNLETFGNYYQSQDAIGIEEVTEDISHNLTQIYNIEFSIFGTPLGDKILSGQSKERSDRRLKTLCTESVAQSNKDYLESIALEEVDKSRMDEDELLERKEKEEEYLELMEEYREESKSEEEDCYQKVMDERAEFGNRVVESENADLESELMQMLDSYEQRQSEESDGGEELDNESDVESGDVGSTEDEFNGEIDDLEDELGDTELE